MITKSVTATKVISVTQMIVDSFVTNISIFSPRNFVSDIAILDLQMPYIVKLFLQKQNQVGKEGSECSGTIIDNHWIATSFACCENIVAFRLLEFGGKRMMKVEQGSIGIGPLKIENQEQGL